MICIGKTKCTSEKGLFPPIENKALFHFLYIKDGLPFEIRGGLSFCIHTVPKGVQVQIRGRGPSFCSSSRCYLQNEQPIDFASADIEQSI